MQLINLLLILRYLESLLIQQQLCRIQFLLQLCVLEFTAPRHLKSLQLTNLLILHSDLLSHPRYRLLMLLLAHVLFSQLLLHNFHLPLQVIHIFTVMVHLML
jgi:hypothetical protein